MKYDLHTHTNLSDGEFNVVGNVNKAQELGLDGIAITDHDNIDSWEIIDANTFDIPVIKGVELSTFYEGESVHVLGYYLNDGGNYEELGYFLKDMRERRKKRVLKMIELLKQFDIDVTYESVEKFADGSIGRPHVAQAIMEKYPDRNYTMDYIFERFIGNGKPAYVQTYNFSTVDAIKLLHKNHCIAVLAHPLLIKKISYRAILNEEFDGVEVFYPYNKTKDYKEVLKLAKMRRLIITGGSDYHGPNVRNTMGMAYNKEEYLEEFLTIINMKRKN